MHAAIEEQLFYPVTRATVPDTEDIALESLEEHHIVKWVLSELDGMDPEDERFDAKVTVLIENVRHHVEEEEEEYFPKVRDELGRNALDDLGDAMAAAKKVAPTHPHPRSPDTPPGNLVVGTAAGVVDRVGDTVSGVAQGGVTALGDLIATILGRKKPSRRLPAGRSTARTTADKVRAKAAEATDAVIEAATDAQKAAKADHEQGTRHREAHDPHRRRTAPPRRPRPPSPAPRAPPPSARKGAKRTAHHGQARRHDGQAHAAARPGRAPRPRPPRPARPPSAPRTTAKRAATTTGRTARKAATLHEGRRQASCPTLTRVQRLGGPQASRGHR